ncbi:MAG TPA: hybrid sensor histidine kinase/response regulator, partial [Cyclobacteriaceae bacterium]|nr:hybrid sensor histidine kinase/response regulator [Cyclobacteriaceae bacterium]
MEKELRILILEDVEEDAALVEYALKKEKFQFTRIRVDTRQQFTEALDTFKPDVILSDHSLPQFNSLEALKICQLKKLDVPFILVTGAVSEEFAVNCLKRGADDYVLKSNLSRLPLAIRYALRQHRYESNRQAQEEILRQQNEQLVKINKELDSFVYSVSHDLRSPLSSILGLVNIAKLEGFRSPEMLSTYFEMIERSVLKLDETIKEILDYSRNSRGELNIEKVALEDMIKNAFAQMQYLPGYNTIERKVDIHQHTAFHSDVYRVSVILLNLISNSLKYGDDSKEQKFIHVTATITPANCLLQVRDNGIGIHPDYVDNVFNMFFRATDRSQGAGLGLYIVKEMVEKLSGTISVNSELGQGTAITISIPNKLML